MEKSQGTEAFIAEFNRLLGRCVRAAAAGPRPPVREAFELLFGLLRHIDEGHDDMILAIFAHPLEKVKISCS
jgi:hypothetical protein